MIRWNSSQQDPQRLIRISIPPVKASLHFGANYQPTIQQVLKEREDELNELHSRLMLGFRHNRPQRRTPLRSLVTTQTR